MSKIDCEYCYGMTCHKRACMYAGDVCPVFDNQDVCIYSGINTYNVGCTTSVSSAMLSACPDHEIQRVVRYNLSEELAHFIIDGMEIEKKKDDFGGSVYGATIRFISKDFKEG